MNNKELCEAILAIVPDDPLTLPRMQWESGKVLNAVSDEEMESKKEADK